MQTEFDSDTQVSDPRPPPAEYIQVHPTSKSWQQVWLTFVPVLIHWWRPLFLAYSFSLLSVTAAVIAPWPLKFIIDNVLSEQPLPDYLTALQQQFEPHILVIFFAISAAVLATAAAIFSALEKNLNARVREQMTLHVRKTTLAHIETLSLANDTTHRSGELVLRLVDDVGHVVRLLTKTLAVVARYLLTMIAVLVAMFWLQPVMGLIGLFIIFFMVLLVRSFAGKLHKASKTKRRNEGHVAALAQEVIRGLPGIQALGMQHRVDARFKKLNENS